MHDLWRSLMTQPDPNIAQTAANQGRDGGLRPGDEHVDATDPDVAAALANLTEDDDA